MDISNLVLDDLETMAADVSSPSVGTLQEGITDDRRDPEHEPARLTADAWKEGGFYAVTIKADPGDASKTEEITAKGYDDYVEARNLLHEQGYYVTGEAFQKDYLAKFLEKIQTEAYKPYKTELSFFDNLLNGGVIRQTLLLLLAAPGAGKTTLCAQIAEQMAIYKKPVIYLNLEMSKEQMLAKAISGHLARKGIEMTALKVMQGYDWTDKEKAAVLETVDEYREKISPYLAYNPENVSSKLDSIKDYLIKVGEKYKEQNLSGPVVVIDYLHLVSTDKKIDNQELIKQIVKALKDYAINYDTFVIGIVATNRNSNINGKITMESGRDSSNLEYTADYQLSLNYYDIDQGKVKPNDLDGIAELNQAKWRQMIIRVLKGRFVTPGKHARLYFNAANNIFYGEFDTWLPADVERVPFDDAEGEDLDIQELTLSENKPRKGRKKKDDRV